MNGIFAFFPAVFCRTFHLKRTAESSCLSVPATPGAVELFLLLLWSLKSQKFNKQCRDWCQDPIRSCQHLNLKGKTLLAVVNNFSFSVQYKADPKQNMIFSVFSEWAQKLKFLYTTRSWHQSLHRLLNL